MDGKISNFQQIASLRRYTITNGRESGLDVIDCDNGKLRFLLNVGKACDIMNFTAMVRMFRFYPKIPLLCKGKIFQADLKVVCCILAVWIALVIEKALKCTDRFIISRRKSFVRNAMKMRLSWKQLFGIRLYLVKIF